MGDHSWSDVQVSDQPEFIFRNGIKKDAIFFHSGLPSQQIKITVTFSYDDVGFNGENFLHKW